MLKTVNRSKRNKRTLQSGFYHLETQLKSHPAWKGEILLTEGAELLKFQPPFTYILSQGFDRYHYFLSYIDSTQTVKHKNIRIQFKNGKYTYLNGGAQDFEMLTDLIPYCLNCSKVKCKPL